MAHVVVVGGGIVGLSTARTLLRKGVRCVTVLERARALGVGNQTANNSGVVHAGIYYRKGSLKAELCGRGLRESTEYFERHAVPYRRCGKIIVARDDAEVVPLTRIFENAKLNGVPDVRWLEGIDEITCIEPHVAGVAAVHSPATAIVNWAEVARSYAREVTELGGCVLLRHQVTGIQPGNPVRVRIETPDGTVELEADKLVSCAGVHSDRIAVLAGGKPTPRIIPVRGEYLRVRPNRAQIVRGCVYPVPRGGVPFLGVHYTPTMGGDLLVGPNAVPALCREGGSFSLGDTMEMLTYRGSWHLARNHATFAVGEMYRSKVMSAATREARTYVPALQDEDFERVEWSGIRAQAVYENGVMVDDFVFDQLQNVVLTRNAPSPAATSSLPIGERIANFVID